MSEALMGEQIIAKSYLMDVGRVACQNLPGVPEVDLSAVGGKSVSGYNGGSEHPGVIA